MTLYTEGFSHFVTSMTAPIASGRSERGRAGFAPAGKAPTLHGARRTREAQDLFSHYGDTAREILTLLLDRYIERGILQFNALSELMKVQPFDRYGSPSEIAARHFGGVRGMKDAVSRLQTALYP
ncbi:hypothetical protein GO606_011485 [Aromatoleum anaerobium]|nr:type I restriction-modification enzyme R subunit C-terminal domain-containing protein [Aromatoleum anaerobium]MCK0507490.1 hypothetical protein [Aromatoleum anaerobium]